MHQPQHAIHGAISFAFSTPEDMNEALLYLRNNNIYPVHTLSKLQVIVGAGGHRIIEWADFA